MWIECRSLSPNGQSKQNLQLILQDYDNILEYAKFLDTKNLNENLVIQNEALALHTIEEIKEISVDDRVCEIKIQEVTYDISRNLASVRVELRKFEVNGSSLCKEESWEEQEWMQPNGDLNDEVIYNEESHDVNLET